MLATHEYDVLVVGGGVAGVAAALEASRRGLSVALVEKTILWGGMATTGLVPIYMPLCDGHGRQVTFGIAEELFWASIKYGPGDPPSQWAGRSSAAGRAVDAAPAGDDAPWGDEESGAEGRYLTPYSPAAFALGLDELVERSGAEAWFDTLACTPMTGDDGRVAGVEVETKSGRLALGARCTIDATGDADIAFRAGAPCQERGSFPSLLYQFTSLGLAREAVEGDSARRLVTWHGGGSANERDVGYDGPSPKRSAADVRELTAFLVESRRIAREKLAEEQAAAGGRENVYPAALPHMHQVRMSRRILGRETVTADAAGRRVSSSVGMIADCRKMGAVWEVPYGSLVPQEVSGLLAAGRCSSAEGYAWQVTRLIGACAHSGQVAGIAAALAVAGDTTPERLDPADVQREAESRGIVLHI